MAYVEWSCSHMGISQGKKKVGKQHEHGQTKTILQTKAGALTLKLRN